MKKSILSFIVFLMFLGFAKSQSIGLMLGYGSKIEQIGIGANAEFGLTEKLKIAPSFLYYFTEDHDFVKTNLWELNGNVNYYFIDDNDLGVYGLGGLNYTHISVKSDYGAGFGYGSYSASSGKIGVNLGAGLNYNISERLSPYAELKFVISDYDQLVAMIGMKYKL